MAIQPADPTSIPSQTMNENSTPDLEATKTYSRTAEIPSTETQSHTTTDALSIASAIPASGGKAISSALVEKFEIGSGKNKINVRIFREPTIEPMTLEPPRDAKTR